MLPIPGTASLAHLQENVDAAELVLDEPDIEKLDEAA
jgi:aryl-alcohol dehydrogenase-like predicted oxidoreductase